MNWMLLPFRRFADFKGRSRRTEFWLFTLLATALLLIAHYLDGGRSDTVAGMGPAEVLVSALLTIPSIAVTMRRLHDTGRSGLWALLFYGPYVVALVIPQDQVPVLGAAAALLIGGAILLVLLVLPGERGENRFGPDPKV